jgi:hypothetical protein
MLTTEQFFAAFDKAGFLKIAFWSPSAGGAVHTPKVRFKAPTQDALSGDVTSIDYSIEYPATVLVGLKRGEVLTIDGVQYTVRENPESQLDGTRFEAKLRKGA